MATVLALAALAKQMALLVAPAVMLGNLAL
jgi:hypothetical protein